jgi:hypothetical protein
MQSRWRSILRKKSKSTYLFQFNKESYHDASSLLARKSDWIMRRKCNKKEILFFSTGCISFSSSPSTMILLLRSIQKMGVLFLYLLGEILGVDVVSIFDSSNSKTLLLHKGFYFTRSSQAISMHEISDTDSKAVVGLPRAYKEKAYLSW